MKWKLWLKKCVLLGIMGISVFGVIYNMAKKSDTIPYELFKQQAVTKMEEAVIGTNITLHQEIYGTDGVKYRYKLKTDCPHWDYEDRYVSDTPISWIGEYSAVETEATSIEIKFDGNAYALGQYFTVPMLGLSKEDLTLDEFKERLMKTAYQQYEMDGNVDKTIMPFIVLGIVDIVLAIILEIRSHYSNKRSESKNKTVSCGK